ncbi:AAA family ATPase [Thalassobacillus hwangdonensis]|uniref:Nuclease SbcCD subunit C n=1 Tax=Thalassobacillus hwangdonensis TaxID=546108 RepID=A0ABW3L1G5_9BACI
MKALSLTMAAFGPYRDRQTIDFTELGEESIFLVTGPTGAGKTTIFDALCFALYGKASGTDRDHDTLRSHFSPPELATEVEYVFQIHGETYRVIRSPKQKKPKARGEGYTDDPAKAELYQKVDQGEKLIASRIMEVNESLEQLLSLDYEQFRKMIMIPQGEFRKLISENSKEREEILQRIFQTHFYDKITARLKDEAKELKASIQQFEWHFEQEASKITWTDEDRPEDEDNQTQIIEALNEKVKASDLQINEMDKVLDRNKKELERAQSSYYEAKALNEKFLEREKLVLEKEQLVQKEADIQAKRKAYDNAEKASQIIPLEEYWKEKKIEKRKLDQELSDKENEKERASAAFEKIERDFKKEEAYQPELDKKIDHLKDMKQELEKLSKISELKQTGQHLKHKSEKGKKRTAEIEKEIRMMEQEKREKTAIVKKDSQLNEKFYQVKQQLSEQQSIEQKLGQLLENHSKLEEMRLQYRSFKQTYEQKKIRMKERKEAYQTAQSSLNRHHAYVLSHRLQEGEPCPVCGSVDHPSPAAVEDGAMTLEEVDRLQAKYDHAAKEVENLQDKYIQLEAEGKSQQQVTESLYEEVSEIVPRLSRDDIQKSLKLQTREVEGIKERLASVDNEMKEMKQAHVTLEKLETQLEEKKTELEKTKEALQADHENWIRLQTQIDHLNNQVSGDWEGASELERWITIETKSIHNDKVKWEEIQKQYENKRQLLQKFNVETGELIKYCKKVEDESIAHYNRMMEKIEQYEFHSYESYLEAKLPIEKMDALNREIDAFIQRKNTVVSMVESLDSSLSGKQRPDINVFKEQVEKAEASKNETLQAIHTLQGQLKELQNIKHTLVTVLEEMKELSETYYDIGELADLAKGENHLRLSFERYVLSAFLDEILMQANIRFDQMTEHRYQLVRSDQVAKRGAQSGLDLEVMDHHTGQQRSVKTLSGGEGFKAALSLALGMADVVQAHSGGVQLDTLFIDEGFGTLDELSLEQAIGCLKDLQQGNRMLGIISHVPQLKEEIKAKLQILPTPEGSTVDFVFQ